MGRWKLVPAMPPQPSRLIPLILAAAGGFAAEQANSATGVVPIDRAALQQRLTELAAKPPPSDLKMGAMCYAMPAALELEHYSCPTCARRSSYRRWTATGVAPTQAAAEVVQDLDRIRSLARLLTGQGVQLDESRLCAHCSPGAQPSLGLVVKRKDGSEHRTWGVTLLDLQVLSEFLAGKDRHTQFNQGEVPLQQFLPRLRELLGEAPVRP